MRPSSIDPLLLQPNQKRFVPSPLDFKNAAANGDSTPVTGFMLPNFLVSVGL